MVYHLTNYRQLNGPPAHSTPFYAGEDIITCLISLQPGAIVPEHSHEHQNEIFDVIEVEGSFILAGQEIGLKPGMTYRPIPLTICEQEINPGFYGKQSTGEFMLDRRPNVLFGNAGKSSGTIR